MTERAEAERDDAFLGVMRLLGPAFAGIWLSDFNRAVASLALLPGPLAHARDEEASDLYGREVRRMLYRGPGRRRTGGVYRVLYSVRPPFAGDPGEIRVLRVLHGAQTLGGMSPAGEP